MHARGDEREALTVQEETSSEVVISLAFDQRGVLDVPLVHGPDPVWSAWRARSARGRPLRPPLSRPRGTVRVFKEHNPCRMRLCFYVIRSLILPSFASQRAPLRASRNQVTAGVRV